MKNKTISTNSHRDMLEGVEELSHAVTSTLGPRGRNVVLYLDAHNMRTTKDGVTVAKFIRFSNPSKDAGARFVQNAADHTVYHAGDGTTTCVLLAHQLIKSGVNYLEGKSHLMRAYNDGMGQAVRNAINELQSVETEAIDGNLDAIEDVAMISANNDPEIGKLIREGMEAVGLFGMIQTDESSTNKSYVKVVDGMEIQNGYLDYNFVNNPRKNSCDLGDMEHDVQVFVIDDDLSTLKQVVPMLNYIVNFGVNAVVVANDIVGEADAMIRLNKDKKGMNICVVRAPGAGERRRAYSRDLAIYTGGIVIGQDTGTEIENFKPEWGGRCETFSATNKTSRFIGGGGAKEDVENLINSIESDIRNTKDEFAIAKHKQRIQRLLGRAAILMIGAPIEQELGQLNARVDDAIKATQSSVEEGIVRGGGMPFFRISERLRENILNLECENPAWRAGYVSVLDALVKPLEKIICNSGDKVKDVTKRLSSADGKGKGYNAITGEISDLRKDGVINASKVDRVALESALSAAMLFLSVECVIYPEQEPEQ